MAVEFLHELNVPFFKVGSGDTNNFPYLKKTAQKGFCSLHVGYTRLIKAVFSWSALLQYHSNFIACRFFIKKILLYIYSMNPFQRLL